MGTGQQPVLEIRDLDGLARWLPFERIGAGRTPDESHWWVRPRFAAADRVCFRIDPGTGAYIRPRGQEFFETDLRRLWVQDQQVFSYRPAHKFSPSQVLKVPSFTGNVGLPARNIYIYLPRGYAEHLEIDYPVLYMQDGQNCFEAFVGDSYAGSWQADSTADRLIATGKKRECLIVAISHGGTRRLAEYLPPGLSLRPPAEPARKSAHKKKRRKPTPIAGRADRTAAFYQQDVDPFVVEHYRTLSGREFRATCGSSLGGLFSAYLASDHPDFAAQHAVVSPSFWATKADDGHFASIRALSKIDPNRMRLWIDAGTENDGQAEFEIARDLLLEQGFVEGDNFRYYLDEGAGHSESVWARRLEMIWPFLFPID